MEDQAPAPASRPRWPLISVALNLVLIVVVVVALVGPRLSPGARSNATEAPATRVSPKHDLRATEQALRSAGYGSEEAKRVVYLIVADSAGGAAPPYEYWKPASAREVAERIARYQGDETTRAVLTQVYGKNAASDPAFAAAFRPYERELPMLHPEEQLQLQSLRIEHMKATGGRVTAGPPQRDMVEGAFAKDLRQDALFEFQLRESPLARGLSAMPFDFTEQEFRELFRALAAANPERVMQPVASMTELMWRDPATFAAFQSVLGAERSAQFARVRDPRYMMLRRIASMHGVEPDKIDQAYALMSSSGASATALEDKLTGLLGKEATAMVLQAYDPVQRMPGPASPTVPGAPMNRGRLTGLPAPQNGR